MFRCYDPDNEHQPLQDTILCNLCAHKHPGFTCDAFPNGIPMSVLRTGEHFLPVKGDNGIVFEEK